MAFVQNGARSLRRLAHEQPVIFYSLVIGAIGPILAVGVPPIRKAFGYVPPERFPTSYPLPQRPRREVTGYDDE